MHSQLTILVADDDDDDVLLLRRALERSRLVNPVEVVRDGAEAIQYLAGEGKYADRARYARPFLLLLDIYMPKVNGLEVLRWLEEHPDLRPWRVAVLTTSPDERDRASAMALGADSYFVKPGSLDELVKLMLRVDGRWLLLSSQDRPDVCAAESISDRS